MDETGKRFLEMKAAIHFEPRDIWVGVYWDSQPAHHDPQRLERLVDVYICALPMLPLHLSWVTCRATAAQ